MRFKIKPAERTRSVRIREAILSHVIALGLALLFWSALIAIYALDLQPGPF